MNLTRECPFCRWTHAGEFEEDLDRAIMACRQKAPPYFRGDLDAWQGEETIPIPVERELLQRTRELEQSVRVTGP